MAGTLTSGVAMTNTAPGTPVVDMEVPQTTLPVIPVEARLDEEETRMAAAEISTTPERPVTA
ncbi:hypothetical protein MMC16_001622 [Acarospora aff. strigata]|nr:hypothetical protein [Acarospora aff. strigata]